MTMLAIGLHENVPQDVYFADPSERPSLSSHVAKVLLSRSAEHAQLIHPRFGGAISEKPTDEKDAGSIIDSLLLGGGADLEVLKFDDYRTKDARSARDTARASGKIPILAEKLAPLKVAAEKIRKRMPVDFSAARCQLTAIWESDGCPCRARLDSLFGPDGGWLIADLKTSDDISIASAARTIFSYGYHIQAAAYLDAFETLRPDEAGRVKFRLLFAEREPPYGVLPVDLAGDFVDLGKRQWQRAKMLWAQCLATGAFPGYPASKTVNAPTWAISEETEVSILAAGPTPF
jgi:hypothetical protein